MYCKNCGKELVQGAAVCTQCGVAVGNGQGFCANCGAVAQPGAAVCTQCGASLTGVPGGAFGTEQKSKLTAGLLGILLGGLGVHNFYLGYTGKGIAQICLTFCFGIGYIWGLIEGILILTGKINTDAKGIPLKD